MKSLRRIQREKKDLQEGIKFNEEIISKIDCEREKSILKRNIVFFQKCYNELCEMEKECLQ